MPSFASPDGTFFATGAGGPVRVEAPTSGSTIAMMSTERALFVNNGATLAALTVNLPNVAPGEKVELAFKGTITALTVHDAAGGTITGAPTSGGAGAARVMRYVNKTVGWVLWK